MWSQIGFLLISFFQIGLFSIGGGYATIPLIQEQVVDLHHWLNFQEFTDIITISQMTPGPIAVNTSTFVGLRIAGFPGAAVSTFGCVISGFCISLLLFCFFQKFKKSDRISDVLKGLRSTSIGLIISAAVTILIIAFCGVSDPKLIQSFQWIAAVIFLGAFFLLRKFKLNPILVMVLCGIVGVIVY